MTQIELLSPAGNLDYGKAAILHGADAVYIGASLFGARAGASNSVTDIEQLVRFAHLYRAKVYATLNTILFDNEIEQAVQLARQLYEAGIDALIIQDMGLLQCGLPPVPLFASTQTHNHTPEKVAFLEKTGFQRVILARELNLDEIEKIREQTTVELEFFVHGALCVSYSGQCYMSHAVAKRSGNRGVCAQPCRSSYQLIDAGKNILIEDAHLLSLKDLNLSDHLSGLLRAGITSFKIEGRLKDLNYLKNITAFYRRKIDAILEKDSNLSKSSSGKTELFFEPNPYKTFNRGYTAYFINGRKEKVAFPQTQKSIGEFIGTVKQVYPQSFIIDTQIQISNGDGLCYLHPKKGLEGTLVNKVEGNKIYPAKPLQIKPGMKIYRNNDFLFEKLLSGNSADRRIGISFRLRECKTGYLLQTTDEDGNQTEQLFETEKIPAKEPDKSREQIKTQLSKLGNTPFICREPDILPDFSRFIPTAELNKMRRNQTQMLENCRIEKYKVKNAERKSENIIFPEDKLDYSGNVANKAAKAFYQKHGVKIIEDAFELQNDDKGKVLMTCKHCIKYQYDKCPVHQHPKEKWKEPLFLRDRHSVYRLEFDCRNCVMKVLKS